MAKWTTAEKSTGLRTKQNQESGLWMTSLRIVLVFSSKYIETVLFPAVIWTPHLMPCLLIVLTEIPNYKFRNTL